MEFDSSRALQEHSSSYPDSSVSTSTTKTGSASTHDFDVDIGSRRELHELQRLEQTHGQKVHEWVDEGMPREAMGSPSKMRAFRKQGTVQQSSSDTQRHVENGSSSAESGGQLQRMIQNPTRSNQLAGERARAINWINNLNAVGWRNNLQKYGTQKEEILHTINTEETNLKGRLDTIKNEDSNRIEKLSQQRLTLHELAKLDAKRKALIRANQLSQSSPPNIDPNPLYNKRYQETQIAQQKEQFEQASVGSPPLTSDEIGLVQADYKNWADGGVGPDNNRQQHFDHHYKEFDVSNLKQYDNKIEKMLNRRNGSENSFEKYVQPNNTLASYDPMTGQMASGQLYDGVSQKVTGYRPGPNHLLNKGFRRLYLSTELINTTQELATAEHDQQLSERRLRVQETFDRQRQEDQEDWDLAYKHQEQLNQAPHTTVSGNHNTVIGTGNQTVIGNDNTIISQSPTSQIVVDRPGHININPHSEVGSGPGKKQKKKNNKRKNKPDKNNIGENNNETEQRPVGTDPLPTRTWSEWASPMIPDWIKRLFRHE